jgi:Ca2+-dependent lipid-binding protein/WD40 repeat protein
MLSTTAGYFPPTDRPAKPTQKIIAQIMKKFANITTDEFINILLDDVENQDVVNKFGFTNPATQIVSDTRPDVMIGPFDIRLGRSRRLLGRDQVPRRIRYRMGTQFCVTCVQPPTDWNPNEMKRSAQLPCIGKRKMGLELEHIHGYTGTKAGADQERVPCRNLSFNSRGEIVFYTAAVGVVHNPRLAADNQAGGRPQKFFLGHNDDISCLAVDPQGLFVATGQVRGMGPDGESKEAFISIWNAFTMEEITQIGVLAATEKSAAQGQATREGLFGATAAPQEAAQYESFYKRAVGAVAFSSDSTRIVASGEDDRHKVGLWDWGTGKLLGEEYARNGTPPQIYGLSWCPTGTCDFVSHGDNNVSFWKFLGSSPTEPDFQVLKGKYDTHPPPRKTFDVCWTAPGRLISCGSNGRIYVWSAGSGKCTHSFLAHHLGGIGVPAYTVCIDEDAADSANISLFTGGADGKLRRWHLAADQPRQPIDADHPDMLEDVDHPRVYKERLLTTEAERRRGYLKGKRYKFNMKGAKQPDALNLNRSKYETEDVVNSREANVSGLYRVKKPVKAFGKSGESRRAAGSGAGAGGGDGGGASLEETCAYSAAVTCVRWHAKHGMVVGTLGSQPVKAVQRNRQPEPSDGLLMEADKMSMSNILWRSAEDHKRGRSGGGDFEVILAGHVAELEGLASCSHETSKGVYVTAGQDGRVCLWDLDEYRMMHNMDLYYGKTKQQATAVGLSLNGTVAAVGTVAGRFGLVRVEAGAKKLSHLDEGKGSITWQKRVCRETISVLKFCPNDARLAVGSHDNYIDLYSVSGDVSNWTEWAERGRSYHLNYVARCKGHSSYILSLDWSADGSVIQSNCAAREILYWEPTNGNRLRSTFDDLEADTEWDEWSCLLGFPVMGIWPEGCNGLDVNAASMASLPGDWQFLVTTDDYGSVKLFNYPCTVRNAPSLEYFGHSSHVTAVCWVEKTEGENNTPAYRVITTGGIDSSVFQWRLTLDPGARKGDVEGDPAAEFWKDQRPLIEADQAETASGLDQWDEDQWIERERAEKAAQEQRQKAEGEARKRAQGELDKREAAEKERRVEEAKAAEEAEAMTFTGKDLDDKLDMLVVRVCKCTNLKKMDMFNATDPFVTFYWNNEKLLKNKTIHKNTNPIWTENSEIKVNLPKDGANSTLRLEVNDHDPIGRHTFFGEVMWSGAEIVAAVEEAKNNGGAALQLPLQKKKNGKEAKQTMVGGEIFVQFELADGEESTAAAGVTNQELAQAIADSEVQDVKPVAPAHTLMVHVRDAFNLPNKEMLGKSDPFCEIFWNNKQIKHRGGKTKVINATLNPKWLAEVFEVPLQKLRVEVWDSDSLLEGGQDDFLGEVIVEGETLAKVGTQAQDMTLDLKSKPGGKLTKFARRAMEQAATLTLGLQTVEKVKVRIMMARALKGADGLITAGKSDPYVKVFWGDEAGEDGFQQLLNLQKKKRTKYVKQNLNPEWHNEVFEIPVRRDKLLSSNRSLRLEVYDYDIGSSLKGGDDFLGQVTIKCSEMAQILDEAAADPHAVATMRDLQKIEHKKDKYVGGSIGFSLESSNRVRVECQKAANLPRADMGVAGGKSDPYCKVFWNDDGRSKPVLKTKVIKNDLDPIWGPEHDNSVEIQASELRVDVYDSDTVGKKFMGQVTLTSDGLSHFPTGYERYSLANPKAKKEEEGELGLHLQIACKMRIQVLNAKGLAKADSWGSCDPYVKVVWTDKTHDEEVSNEKTKTKTNMMNPVWDNEFFEVHVPHDIKNFARELRFEVWNKNTLSSDNFLGQVVLNADPLTRFEQGVKELALEKKAGEKKQDFVQGSLGFNIKIEDGGIEWAPPVEQEDKTSEKEQASDAELSEKAQNVFDALEPAKQTRIEPQGPTNKLRVRVLEAKELKKTGTTDGYCKIKWHGKDLAGKHETSVVKDTLNPEWAQQDATFDIPLDKLRVELFGKTTLGSTFLGQATLEAVALREAVGAGEKQHQLLKRRGKAGKKDSIPDNVQLTLALQLVKVKKLHILEAKGLAAADKATKAEKKNGEEGTSDPYVRIQWNGKKLAETPSIPKTLTPVWTDQIFELPGDGQELTLEVFDKDGKLEKGLTGSDDFLGQVTAAFDEGEEKEADGTRWAKLEAKEGAKGKKFNQHVKEGAMLRYRIEESEKIVVQCVRAEGLEKKVKAFCKVFWNDDEVHKTDVCKSSDTPEWGADQKNETTLPHEQLTVELFDKNTMSDTFHGQVCLVSDAFSMFKQHIGSMSHTLGAKAKSAKQTQGELVLDLQYMKRMQVHIVNAMGLAKADLIGTSDPFVTVYWKTMEGEEYKEVHKTKVHSKNLEPVFDEICDVYLPMREEETKACRLKFEVYDNDLIGKNLLGVLELDTLEKGYKVHKLQQKAGSGSQDLQKGFLGVRLDFEDGDLGGE